MFLLFFFNFLFRTLEINFNAKKHTIKQCDDFFICVCDISITNYVCLIYKPFCYIICMFDCKLFYCKVCKPVLLSTLKLVFSAILYIKGTHCMFLN